MHKKEIKKNCLTCGKEFFIRKYIQKRSKGNYCCHKCAYIGVRKRVKVKCACCDYDECVDILEVHHIDGNRKNNNLDNLIILCPNCHRKITKDLFVLEILGNGTARRGHLICNQNSR